MNNGPRRKSPGRRGTPPAEGSREPAADNLAPDPTQDPQHVIADLMVSTGICTKKTAMTIAAFILIAAGGAATIVSLYRK